jgi:hypothetical protein
LLREGFVLPIHSNTRSGGVSYKKQTQRLSAFYFDKARSISIIFWQTKGGFAKVPALQKQRGSEDYFVEWEHRKGLLVPPSVPWSEGLGISATGKLAACEFG